MQIWHRGQVPVDEIGKAERRGEKARENRIQKEPILLVFKSPFQRKVLFAKDYILGNRHCYHLHPRGTVMFP